MIAARRKAGSVEVIEKPIWERSLWISLEDLQGWKRTKNGEKKKKRKEEKKCKKPRILGRVGGEPQRGGGWLQMEVSREGGRRRGGQTWTRKGARFHMNALRESDDMSYNGYEILRVYIRQI